tara:strand:- start:1713 stop:2672 length:960 start_codon:yes stop_codon:yes gene_type:complete
LKKKIKYNLSEEIRLDKFLNQEIPDFSRTKIQNHIKKGIIKVDDYNVKPSYLLKVGQLISIDEEKITNDSIPFSSEKISLNILYEDEDIIVVDKSSGIVVHPGIGNKNGTLLNGLLYYCSSLSNINNRPGIIHRLDKETSGVIIFAKTDYAHYFISEQFANRTVKKEYLAITLGNLPKMINVKGYIKRHPKNRLKFKLFENNGKFSSSRIECKSDYNIPISLANVFPETGRTHQIRVHLSSLGYPILNDELYGGGQNIINSFHQKYKSNLEKVFSLVNRVALHAHKIEFNHPSNNKKFKITAPIPKDFKKVFNYLNEIK